MMVLSKWQKFFVLFTIISIGILFYLRLQRKDDLRNCCPQGKPKNLRRFLMSGVNHRSLLIPANPTFCKLSKKEIIELCATVIESLSSRILNFWFSSPALHEEAAQATLEASKKEAQEASKKKLQEEAVQAAMEAV